MTDTLDERVASGPVGSVFDWRAAAEQANDGVVALRRAIHADPEIGLHCPRTVDKLKSALAGLPLTYRSGPSTTGFTATLTGDGGAGTTVLLRGDMDALPIVEETGLDFASRTVGSMHACGHDAHSAMLVGAARVLCTRRASLRGTIVFMFQPGEEGFHGARFMIDDGLLDDPRPDAAFALHVSPNMPAGLVASRPGTFLASADGLAATIQGRGGHGAMPHDCIDPIPIACEIVMALQSHISRRVPVADPAVLTIAAIHAGTAHNIIASTAELRGTLRSLSAATREASIAAFRRIVEQVAAAHGAEGEAIVSTGYPALINDPRAVALAAEVTAAAGLGDWLTLPAPLMVAEDFAYVLDAVPGAMVFLGAAPAGSDANANPPLHNSRMRIAEEVMTRGVALHCAFAEAFLERGFG